MILVLLGTQNNSFCRLLQEIQKNIESGVIKDKVIVQAGYTKFKSKDMKIFDFIPIRDLNKLQDDANLIITHGGVGSIVSSINKGKKVIAIPRLHEFGEHVNNHQTEIVDIFNKKGFIIGINNVEDLELAIKQSYNFIPNKYQSNTKNIINIISNFIDEN